MAGRLEDKRSRKTPGRSQGATGRREMGATCASCSEAVVKQDSVCRGKQQGVERMKEGTGQVLARGKPTWSTVPSTETGGRCLKMAEPIYSSLPSLSEFW